jgi:hypothetical protein
MKINETPKENGMMPEASNVYRKYWNICRYDSGWSRISSVDVFSLNMQTLSVLRMN